MQCPHPYLLLALILIVLASCKGTEQACSPTDPQCGGAPAPRIMSIAVSSPVVDTVMAVGRSAQLMATAASATGGSVATGFAWSSTVPATATVDVGGLVTARSAGMTLVQASAGAVTGELLMRAVDADLPAVTSTLSDPLTTSLRSELGATAQSAVQAHLDRCASHVEAGNVLAIEACLAGLRDVGGAGANDATLLAVLGLLADHARRRLQL